MPDISNMDLEDVSVSPRPDMLEPKYKIASCCAAVSHFSGRHSKVVSGVACLADRRR